MCGEINKQKRVPKSYVQPTIMFVFLLEWFSGQNFTTVSLQCHKFVVYGDFESFGPQTILTMGAIIIYLMPVA